MARKRIESLVELKSWNDVDDSLRRIAELERKIEAANAAMQETIDAAKAETGDQVKPMAGEIKDLERQITLYSDAHREDMGKAKSKALNYGTVGYRKSTKVVLPRAAAKLVEMIRQLKAKGMSDCVVQPPETVSKEALAKYPPNDIFAVGAGLDVNDAFWYEVDKERVEGVS